MKESEETIKEYEAQNAVLKAEAQAAFQVVNDKWANALNDIQETRITPKKSDILFEAFGITWLPYWSVKVEGEVVEMAAWAVG
ncbi:MAG: hypothetical protein HY023_04335 [Chloroflexi bacterium]|nr:hypothetical protein [Chloroflexota bacterium]